MSNRICCLIESASLTWKKIVILISHRLDTLCMDGSRIKDFARYLPFILIICSIGGLLFGGIVLCRWDYSIRGLAVAIPFFIAALSVVLIYRYPLKQETRPVIFQIKMRTTLILYALLYVVSSILLVLKVDRIWYLLVVMGLYCLVMMQIFSKNLSIRSILCEITLIMANIIYGITFSYPIFFRTTDVMSHIFLAKVTYLSGHVIPLDLDVSYSPFPLYHIFIAECSHLMNLPIQETLFLVTCPMYVIVILFLYKIILAFLKDPQVALLTCLLYSMSNVVLAHGIEMVTSVTAYIGFVILLYLIFKSGNSENHKSIFQCLALILVISIMFVHQVSIAQIVSLLLLFMAIEYISSERKYFSTIYIQFIVVLFLAYWTLCASNFIEYLAGPRLDIDPFNLGFKNTVLQDPTMSTTDIAIAYLYNNIDLSIFAVFAVIGICYMLWKQKPKYLIVIGFFSLVTLALYLPTPLSTTEVVAHLFRIDRFQLLISPVMAFAMAYGLQVVVAYTRKNQDYSRWINPVLSTTIVLFMIFSLSGVVLTDSTGQRLYFTSGELNGFNFVLDTVPYGSQLKSDYCSSRFFIQPYFSLTDKLGLPYYHSSMLQGIESQKRTNQYIIIRDSEFHNGGLRLGSQDSQYIYPPTTDNVLKLNRYMNSGNIIFSNDEIYISYQ